MPESENAPAPPATPEQIQQAWPELNLRLAQLEADREVLQQEIKTLRVLLERVIEHRQKSHGELVLLLTGLISRLPLNDVGAVVSRLVEHHTQTNQVLTALGKGTADVELPKPAVLKNLEQTKRELAAALPPLVDELLRLETPIEPALLQALPGDPEVFFTPRMVRASRCFIKGQVPRERVVREFGEPALAFFTDMTTDPKLNPHPKADEIVLGFKPEFEALFQQNPTAVADKRQELTVLYQRVQRAKAATEQARAQKTAFLKLSFIIELLHYYEHQNTEPADVVFAQRQPAVIEQLVLAGQPDALDDKFITEAESLLSHIINPDHRHAVVNNLGKAGGLARTLGFILRLRTDKVPAVDQLVTDFLKHLVPPRQTPPAPAATAAVLRHTHPEMQKLIIKTLMTTERLGRPEAEKYGKAVAVELGLGEIAESLKLEASVPPEVERQMAWGKIKDLIARRTEPPLVAAAIRERLYAKYDAEEIRQSWITLTEADPMSLIRIFCHLPYRSDGKTDAIARPVLETYVTRLMHQKYAATYHKVVTSLRNMFRAKPDSPTLLNFVALVRWVDAQAANKLMADIGMPVPA